MQYILDYIEAEKWEAHNAMPASAEVDAEMEEVLNYIDAQKVNLESNMQQMM